MSAALVSGFTARVAVLGSSEYPEANPLTAFNAGEDQRIWRKPGLLVLEAKQNPISRATITGYEPFEPFPVAGFLKRLDKRVIGGSIYFTRCTRGEKVWTFLPIRNTPIVQPGVEDDKNSAC